MTTDYSSSSSLPYAIPSLEGYPTLHELSDAQAARHPDRPFYSYTNDDAPDTLIEISHLELNRATHRAAAKMSELPGYNATAREVVAIVASTDTLVYVALFLGALRAGFVPFFMSPQHTVTAIVGLMKATNCTRILTTPTSRDRIADQVTNVLSNVQTQLLPTLDELFPYLGHESTADSFQPFKLPITEAKPDDIYLYLHSSGSTGIPKPIAQTRRVMSCWCDRDHLRSWASYSPPLRMAANPLSAFHALGVIFILISPLVSGVCVTIYPPIVRGAQQSPYVPSPSNFIEHTMRANCQAIVGTASLVQEWAQKREHLEYLKSMAFVLVGASALAPKIGDYVSKQGVVMIPVYGATELGCVSSLDVLPQGVERGWMYIRFDSQLACNWVEQGDGTREAQFMATERHNPAVLNISGKRGYTTSDLFVPHPSEPNLWKIVGRIDNVICLATGQKVAPEFMEGIITSHPLVKDAVVFGSGRVSLGVIVDPREGALDAGVDEAAAAEAFKAKIRDIITEANHQSPGYARVFKDMVTIAKSSKPLPRSAKGTVLKKAALALYESEIEDLYSGLEGGATTNAANLSPQSQSISFTDVSSSRSWLISEIKELLCVNIVDQGSDLFFQGLNSIHATVLRNRVVRAVGPEIPNAARLIPIEIVFEHPTVEKLAQAIFSIVTAGTSSAEDQASCSAPEQAIEAAIERFSDGIRRNPNTHPSSLSSFAVLVTGSTGQLGSHLLASLLSDPRVTRIYALNRSSPTVGSQINRFKAHGLNPSRSYYDKLVFLDGALDKKLLGLHQSTYDELLSNVNVIIHNAWMVNFNHTLASYSPLVEGSRNLIELALKSSHASTIRFSFTSTISSVHSWDQSTGAVPEEPVSDSRLAVGSGYGESKFVVERLLEASGIHSTFFRITQLCGSDAGFWTIHDWFPSLVRTAIAMGSLPSSDGTITWVPLSDAASVILDDALAAEFSGHNAFNLVNPRSVPWNTMINHINHSLVQNRITTTTLPLISFTDWLNKLEGVAADADAKTVNHMPAIKLLPFFRTLTTPSVATPEDESRFASWPAFQTKKLQERSSTMKHMKLIDSEAVGRWVRYWVDVGFLQRPGSYN